MILVYFDKRPKTFMDWYKAIKQQYGGDWLSTCLFALLGWMKGPRK